MVVYQFLELADLQGANSETDHQILCRFLFLLADILRCIDRKLCHPYRVENDTLLPAQKLRC